MSIIELSTGHVFASGSVVSIGPLVSHRPDYSFSVVGIGFVVEIRFKWSNFGDDDEAWDEFNSVPPKVRQEAIDKLIGATA